MQCVCRNWEALRKYLKTKGEEAQKTKKKIMQLFGRCSLFQPKLQVKVTLAVFFYQEKECKEVGNYYFIVNWISMSKIHFQ